MRDVFKALPHAAPFDGASLFLACIHESGGDLNRQPAIKPALASGRVKRHEIECLPLEVTRIEGLRFACRHQLTLFIQGTAAADNREINPAFPERKPRHLDQCRMQAAELLF